LLRSYCGAVPRAPAWFSRVLACHPKQQRIEVEGASIELLTWGRLGKPGLLFQHGFSSHGWWWAFIAPFLADRFRCTALTWSGMGDSTWRNRYSLDLYVQEAKAAISATNLDRGPVRPIIVGHSFGGFIAHAFASRHPELLSGAILVDYGSTLGECWRRRESAQFWRRGRAFWSRPVTSIGLYVARCPTGFRVLCVRNQEVVRRRREARSKSHARRSTKRGGRRNHADLNRHQQVKTVRICLRLDRSGQTSTTALRRHWHAFALCPSRTALTHS
jgi:pimeloyl-ACP methyl ester carboxylesterase